MVSSRGGGATREGGGAEVLRVGLEPLVKERNDFPAK